MPTTPPRKCAEQMCNKLTHYRYCRDHRSRTAARSGRNRLCLTLSEIANICDHLSRKGVHARAELTETGIALLFNNRIEPPRRQDIGFVQLLAISNTDETTEFIQSILRSFARDAQRNEGNPARVAAA